MRSFQQHRLVPLQGTEGGEAEDQRRKSRSVLSSLLYILRHHMMLSLKTSYGLIIIYALNSIEISKSLFGFGSSLRYNGLISWRPAKESPRRLSFVPCMCMCVRGYGL